MLVVGEIALTVVLLVSAGLLATSFVRLQHVDPGFRVDQVTLVALPLPQSKYPDGKRQTAFYQRVLEGMQQRGEIQSAAVLFPSPIAGANANGTFTVEGRPVPTRSGSPVHRDRVGLRRLLPHAGDPDDPGAEVRAAGSRSRARRGDRQLDARSKVSAPGRMLSARACGSATPATTGSPSSASSADSRNMGLNEAPTPLLYLPYHRFPLAFMSIAARSSAGAGAVASIVREAVKRADPDMPVDKVVPLGQVLQESIAEPRFRTLLLGAFALMAVVLAAVGVYGLISFSVAQRTREIGIRVALGAQSRQVMAPVLREGVGLALTGIAIGIAASLAATRLLAEFLFGVEPTDPMTYTAVALLLLAIALVASYIPSRRALRVDPITALRAE